MRWLALTLLVCTPALASAQGVSDVATEPLGSTFGESFLRDLPLSDSIYTVLETVQPSIISDRFTGGGLFTGEPARVGGFQASWTQTRFVIGDVDVTDPTGRGGSLIFPDLGPWSRVRVATGRLSDDVDAAGLVLDLTPRAPTAKWQHSATGMGSGGELGGHASTLSEPTIARLESRQRAEWTSTGPITDRLGASLWLAYTGSSQFERAATVPSDAHMASGLASVVYTGSDGASLETLAAIQRIETDLEHRLYLDPASESARETHVHIQSTWRSRPGRSWPWRAFGAYTQQSRSDTSRAALSVERLVDGPVSAIASPARGTTRQWTVGGRTESARGSSQRIHHLAAGVDIVGASQRTPPSSVQSIDEYTDALLSREWVFRNPQVDSRRGSFALSVHAGDTVELSRRLTLSAGLRYEAVTGSADGAAQGVNWQTLLPRARLDWRLHTNGSTWVFVGYRRSAYRLALDMLAFGDPAAPTADVYRADPGLLRNSLALGSAEAPLVARTGPGAGPAGDLTRIDPDLGRPVSDELVIGFEIKPRTGTRFQLAAVGRRESGFIGLADTGAPAGSYTVSFVNDPGANTGDPADDKVVPVYARIPSTFGADRYLLTNTGEDASYSGNLELSGQYAASRLTLYGGATASIAQGPAAARGYGPLENDQSVSSDWYVTPNGETFVRGRLFNDRAFTLKVSGVYRFPWDVRLGAIARYQDGQPFSRMLVFPDLPQGAEAVRAFPAGDSRFRFIGTLDTRLTKGFTAGRSRIDLILDVYNLPALTYDVEERVATAPNDRTPIAIQPSRTFQVGARLSF